MWSGALAHAIQLKQGEVEAHEVLQCLLGDGGGTGEAGSAAVEAQGGADFLEDQVVGQHEAPGHCVLPAFHSKTNRKSHDTAGYGAGLT